MVIKKQDFGDDEILIFDEAVIYKRGDYWQFRLWLPKENKYARKSLKTTNRSTAIEKGKESYLELYSNIKQGKTYFSIDAKKGVELYLAHRQKDVDAGLIVKGRLSTIRSHLNNWLDFIGRDTKLKEMQRTDCENYYHARIKGVAGIAARQVTIQNEQSTINAMMDFLFKKGEASIDGFDFRRLPRIDTRDDSIRRSTFTRDEITEINAAIEKYWDRDLNKLDELEWYMRMMAGYFFRMAFMSGLRIGELMQLRWNDVVPKNYFAKKKKKYIRIMQVMVRAETSKVRKSRILLYRDDDNIPTWKHRVRPLWEDTNEHGKLVFSLDGKEPFSKRALHYHFERMLTLAGIDQTNRNLVPYSFRHYFITERIMAGLNYQQVAEMCGTSATQIERTSYHLNDAARMTHALAGYELSDDGLVVPIEE